MIHEEHDECWLTEEINNFIKNRTYSLENLVRTYEFWSHLLRYDCSPYTKE